MRAKYAVKNMSRLRAKDAVKNKVVVRAKEARKDKMLRSIPPKASIPPNIRSSSVIKTQVPRNLTIAKERISPEGFKSKLSWLEEHLAELEQNGASIEIMADVLAQIEALQNLLGGLKK